MEAGLRVVPFLAVFSPGQGRTRLAVPIPRGTQPLPGVLPVVGPHDDHVFDGPDSLA
jgi:hypothetical protein